MPRLDEMTDCRDSILDLLDDGAEAFLTPAARELLKDDPIVLAWHAPALQTDDLAPRDLDSMQGGLDRNSPRDASIRPMAGGSCCCCSCTPCCCCAVAVVSPRV